jgi:hypothetical protein
LFIPDPGVKKAPDSGVKKAPDPGSGSETLEEIYYYFSVFPIYISLMRIRIRQHFQLNADPAPVPDQGFN